MRKKLKELQEQVDLLKSGLSALSIDHAYLNELTRQHLANAAAHGASVDVVTSTIDSERVMRRLAEVEKRLLDHHDTVLVQDPAFPQGRPLERLYAYRGRDPQGREILAVRDPASMATTHVILDPRFKTEDRA